MSPYSLIFEAVSFCVVCAVAAVAPSSIMSSGRSICFMSVYGDESEIN